MDDPGDGPKRTFGQFFKSRRMTLRKTLREFCADHGLDPGNLSKLERGLLPPPASRGKLEDYARFLRLEEGSTEWYEFFDLAAAETGRIPADLCTENVLRRLPAIFRTLRGLTPTDTQMASLVKKVRRE